MLLIACVDAGPFVCTNDDSCGPGGMCEPGGACSFADSMCHTGRRYGDHVESQFAGQCVDDTSGPIAALAAGGEPTCARGESDQVWCWGRGEYGALGEPGIDEALRPVAVSGLAGAAIAAGGQHTCAILATGSGRPVSCWGKNDHGQLGTGDREAQPAPVPVVQLERATAVVAGGDHTCALDDSGDLWCWGKNDHGQLGDGTFTDRTEPVRVVNLSLVTTVVAGHDHTCAGSQDGTVRCWGKNDHGQLGVGDRQDHARPRTVRAFESATALAAGGEHTCAVIAASSQSLLPYLDPPGERGSVLCAGKNSAGQLGDDTESDRTTPVSVVDLDAAIDLVAGDDFTCARTRSDRAVCWGGGDGGQLGTGATGRAHRPDRPVKLARHVMKLVAGGQHACAQTDDGCVFCWGENALGQLGNGDRKMSPAPVPTHLSCFQPGPDQP